MKKISAILFALILSIPVFAQYKPDALIKKGSKIVYSQNGVNTNDNLYSILGPDEYSRYQSGRSLSNWGLGLSIAGGAGTAFGLIQGTNAIFQATKEEDDLAVVRYKRQQTALLGVSTPVLVAGIVLSIVGNNKIKNIIERYNISTSSNGVGITMNF